jgi:hypothetical protein
MNRAGGSSTGAVTSLEANTDEASGFSEASSGSCIDL